MNKELTPEEVAALETYHKNKKYDESQRQKWAAEAELKRLMTLPIHDQIKEEIFDDLDIHLTRKDLLTLSISRDWDSNGDFDLEISKEQAQKLFDTLAIVLPKMV